MMHLDFIEHYPPDWLAQIHEYLAGKRREFTIDCPAQPGTQFQQKVWRAIADIPYGETRTYQELAITIGHPQATRAVGSACGRNQYPIIIPCHRVVAKNGIGGFEFDIGIKRSLLKLEGINL